MKSYEKDGQRILVSADVDLDSDKMFEGIEQNKESEITETNFSKSNCLIAMKLINGDVIKGTLEQFKCYTKAEQFEASYRNFIFWVGYDDFSFLIKTSHDARSGIEIDGCVFEFLKGVEVPVINRLHRLQSLEVLECNGPLFKISLLFRAIG